LAVVSDAVYPWHKGGKEMRYRALTAGLSRMGFDVHVYTMHWWDGARDRIDDGVNYHGICSRRPLYTRDRRSMAQALFFALSCFRLLVARFDAIEADHMPYLQLFPLRIVAWAKRVPLYVTWHEVWGREYWRQYLGTAGLFAAALERVAMRLPSHILAASPETGQRLVDAGVSSSRVSVLPNGVDTQRLLDVAPASRTSDVLYAGRLLPHKNVDVLLDAVAEMNDAGERLTCTIVGEGPEQTRLVNQAVRLGIDSQVRFTGTIEDHDDVIALMKAARVVAIPSVREGFGIAVLEALACGVPVVTADHPDNYARLLVSAHTGVACDPTPSSVADALRRAMSLARFAPSDAGVHRYQWDSIVTDAALIYSSAASRGTHSASNRGTPH
jgi:glycosyltransferase involved in cell wall biosynthesis